MDEEEIENQLHEVKTIQSMGYMDLNHFLEHKYCVAMGLIQFGGSFSKCLGEALLRADRDNAIKILRYWQADCEKHALLYKMYLAKEKANEQIKTDCA